MTRSPSHSEYSEADAEPPDGYEADNTTSTASGFEVGTTQTHSFHVSNDWDWVKFYAVPGTAYDIEAMQVGTNIDLMLEVFYEHPDGTVSNIDFLTANYGSAGSGVVEWTAVDLPLDGLPHGMYYVLVRPQDEDLYGEDSGYELDIYNSVGGGKLIVLAVDSLNPDYAPTGAVAVIDGGAQSKSFNGNLTVDFDLDAGEHTIEVTVPAGYVPAEDPKLAGQVQNASSVLYGNPKDKTTTDGWQTAIFQFIPVARVDGLLRDSLTGTRLEGATLSFMARNGNIEGVVYDGWPEGATYEQAWTSQANGTYPSNLWLPTVDWDMSIALSNYVDGTWEHAVSNPTYNSSMDLGVLHLAPVDANSNSIADSYEDEYFPGGMGSTTNDGDHDGISDGDEYWCGTDPTKEDSVFAVQSISGSSSNGYTVTWQSTPLFTYQVRGSSNLLGQNWAVVHGPREATNDEYQMRWTDTNQVQGVGMFYRVNVITP